MPDIYENNARAVDLMIRSSNSIIRDLVERKVNFTRDETGNLMFTREAAHSQPRILFHEDITGKQITQTLLNEVKTKENIEICEYMTMVDLIEKDNVCGGIIIMDTENNVYPVYAEHVVLACGGLGGLYQNSTNFPHISGDALGIALNIRFSWNIWITYRFIRLHCIPKNRDGDFLYLNQSVEKVRCCWIKTDSVSQMNCSRETKSVRQFLLRWKKKVLTVSGRICVLLAKM